MNHDLQAAYRILGVLERSKSLLDQIFDSLTGASILVDGEGRILRSNTNAAALVGIGTEELLGQNARMYFRGDDRPHFEKALKALASGAGPGLDAEFALTDAAGKARAFHWRLDRVPLPGEDEVALFALVGQEVTELKRALRSVLELEKDLEFARVVQSLTLPQDPTAETPSWRMAAHYEAASQAGGDWWRFEQGAGDRARFLLGDVTGHGVGAGMVTALLTGAYEILRSRDTFPDPLVICGEFNRCLRQLRGQGYWMTFMLLDFDPVAEKIHWYSAAAPPAWILRAEGEVTELGYQSMPLGSGDLELSKGEHPFRSGDRLFAATDGLFEIRPDLSLNAVNRKYVRSLRQEIGDPSSARDRIKSEWEKLRAGAPATDDAAFLIIDRVGG